MAPRGLPRLRCQERALGLVPRSLTFPVHLFCTHYLVGTSHLLLSAPRSPGHVAMTFISQFCLFGYISPSSQCRNLPPLVFCMDTARSVHREPVEPFCLQAHVQPVPPSRLTSSSSSPCEYFCTALPTPRPPAACQAPFFSSLALLRTACCFEVRPRTHREPAGWMGSKRDVSYLICIVW